MVFIFCYRIKMRVKINEVMFDIKDDVEKIENFEIKENFVSGIFIC